MQEHTLLRRHSRFTYYLRGFNNLVVFDDEYSPIFVDKIKTILCNQFDLQDFIIMRYIANSHGYRQCSILDNYDSFTYSNLYNLSKSDTTRMIDKCNLNIHRGYMTANIDFYNFIICKFKTKEQALLAKVLLG